VARAVKTLQIALDCSDPAKLAEFWAAVLNYEIARISEDGERAFLADPQQKGPSFLLHRVPEPKLVKNRLHLDVYIPASWGLPPAEAKPIVDAEAERLRGMGATVLQVFEKPDDYFVVMSDPEGNEFCIA
jgi:hypothetical protein